MENTYLINAKKVLNTMATIYAQEFNQMYQNKNKNKDELVALMVMALEGLLKEEIEYGISRLCQGQKILNFGSFRKLCEGAGVWLSPIEAWEEVIKYEKNEINRIQMVTHEVMGRVKTIYNQDYSFVVRNTFIDFYAKAVEKQRGLSLYPKYWERPSRVKRQPIDTTHNRVGMPDNVRNELMALMKR